MGVPLQNSSASGEALGDGRQLTKHVEVLERSPISSCARWANCGPDSFGDIASDLLVGYTETGQKRRSI